AVLVVGGDEARGHGGACRMREQDYSEVRHALLHHDAKDLLRAREIEEHAGLAVAREAAFGIPVARDERFLAGSVPTVDPWARNRSVGFGAELRHFDVEPVGTPPYVGSAAQLHEADSVAFGCVGGDVEREA